MPEVHDIGTNHYAHRMNYPNTNFPLVDKGDTQEIEYPYRVGKGLVLRLPLSTKALVVGRWVAVKDEEAALTSAIGARRLEHYEDYLEAKADSTRNP